MDALNDEALQSAAWRKRLVLAVLERNFDDEVLVTMLMAGFEQAHQEGIADAADVCRDIAAGAPSARRVAGAIEKALRDLINLNKAIDISNIAA